MNLKKEYQERLTEWLKVTQEIYEQIREDNFSDDTEINLAYVFTNKDEKISKDFSSELQKLLGTHVDVDFLPAEENEPAVYVISGKTMNIKIEIEGLKKLLVKMINLGAKYDCMFEFWEAYLSPGNNTLHIGSSFDISDNEKELYPFTLLLKVFEKIDVMDRYEKYQEPLENLLKTRNIGVIQRIGSILDIEDDNKITGFEIVLMVSNEVEARQSLIDFFKSKLPDIKYSLRLINEDMLN